MDPGASGESSSGDVAAGSPSVTGCVAAATGCPNSFLTLILISIKLGIANYNFWKSQITLRAYDLEGFVTEKQLIMSWLLRSISENMFGHVVGCATSSQVWCYKRYDVSFKAELNSPQNRSSGNSGSGRGYSSHSNPQAYTAFPETIRDDTWYVDSGASHHVTSDAEKLEILTDYKGKGKLIIGDGTFLINRLPTSTLSNKTPYEVLFKEKPLYNHLKSFGCACYPFLRPYNRHKVGFHTTQCVFLGYSNKHKGYRCLHCSGRVYIAQNVTFNENLFPFTCGFSTPVKVANSDHVHNQLLVHNWLPNCKDISGDSEHVTAFSPMVDQPPASSSSSEQNVSPPSNTLPSDVSRSGSIEPNSSNEESDPSPKRPLHHMQTRSKSGIFKPKTFVLTSTLP
ncbi:Retrovirus-related Pol polyprotein from transposon TNT 1-94 [Abeliophyllum distichum]|uniref:Retrovirus-related Pol polyprotein from transposon TNT 1-94 n=1 Tax=Abeliophyllum distichum TaxID=126358 RepID=A0ABD1PBE9_9LAMI